ncbi:DNA cytosine methyltransferase [Mycobacteroides chelonae]|uniref:DNA (cytosine-5-)-methyltransferase n=1 Tax=Mycobacteroides chelonae TaxID=1774 RepID=A0A1S1LCQ2_MYCCH|nr:DNA cytosine methyltransferase [Mycobacteroides chelonae]
MSATAQHRPARRRRRFAHDDLSAVDLFSGFGGLTKAIKDAGFSTIACANHSPYKVEVHEANHPEAEHWIADLVDSEAPDYHSVRDLPPADLLAAGVSCTNHSVANSQKAYAQGLSLFDLEDPEFDERVTRSERDRATANCVLHYAAQHHPRLILIECTTELASWGRALPRRPKVGDGSTYRWWLNEFVKLGYKYRVLYLNSMFFDVPQSRDRLYIAFWDSRLPTPALDHRPVSWCSFCDNMVEAMWTWKTGVPPSGTVRYGTQYEYRCPSCRKPVVPPMTPSLAAMDLRNLGTRIGDRKKPLVPATMARAQRCLDRFAEFPPIFLPADAVTGTEGHPWQSSAGQVEARGDSVVSTAAIMAAAGNTFERAGSNCRSRSLDKPLWAQTATNSTAMVTPPIAVTGQVLAGHRHNGDGKHIGLPMDTVTSTHEKAVLLAIDNYQGSARGIDEPLPTQGGSETLGVLSAGVLPYRRNTVPARHDDPMPTVTAEQIPGLLTAAGLIKNNGSIEEAKYRAHPASNPLGAFVGSAVTQGLLFSGWQDAQIEQRDQLAISMDEWRSALANLRLEDCYYRMMATHEVGRGCGFDVDFADYEGTFVVWGSAGDQVDGFGNAVSPPVGEWIGRRLRAVIHSEAAA